jgi:hypothetical protein
MFNAQTQMYAAYHVTDVASFYKSDNLWTIPAAPAASSASSASATPSASAGSSAATGASPAPVPGAYYVEMRLPDQGQPEFVLVQPMVPASRPNMIAWVAARNDGTARGQVIAYELPANTTIQGPTQIEARIDQDPVVSAQISLWNQSGSQVIRGRLLVIPVGTSFVYLEPVYLQSRSSAFPQLTKIVVASSETVGWGDTLAEALAEVTSGAGTGGQSAGGTGTGAGGAGQTGTSPTPSPAASPPAGLPTDMAGLARYADTHFAAANADRASGNLAGADQELQLVQAALNALSELNGVPPGSPAPSASALPAP